MKPIPYTGVNKFFGVNMLEREIEEMKTMNCNVCYNKHFE
jgi:hypothetical protein